MRPVNTIDREYNPTLEEAFTKVYRCPVCRDEKEVVMEFDVLQWMWFPVSWQDTECACGCTMDEV